MNKILINIRSVKGVIGTIVVDKNRALTYELLPASFTTEHVKSIALPVLDFGRSIDKNMSLDFFFENGVARIYNRKEQIVLILGQPDLNLNMLGIVCREAIPAISRKLSHGQLAYTGEGKPESENISTEFLLRAVNIISMNCIEKIGAYLVTKYLRLAKDELTQTYQVLISVTVDNNGVASLIKGLSTKSDKETLAAFAHWINLFLTYSAKSTNKLKPADIMELTMEIRDKLNLTGFYQLYADVGI